MKQFFKKLIVTVTVLSISGCLSLYAQTFEEYRKQEAENFKKFKQEEEAYLNKMRKEFQEYVDKRDKEFSDFLKGDWKPYKVEAPEKQPQKPKPQVLPTYVPPAVPVPPREESRPVPLKTTGPILVAAPQPKPVPIPPIRKPAEPVVSGVPATFNFYGVPVYLDYDQAFQIEVANQTDQAGIAHYWEKASSSKYSSIVDQLLAKKEDMNLNDYAYYLLVKKFAQTLYPANESGETLAIWFLMLRSGYGMRLATEANKIVLLLPSRNTIYGVSYLTENGVSYYIMTKTDGNHLNTYDKDYAGANRPIDFNIPSPMNLGRKVATKNLKFDYLGTTFQVMVTYDQGLVNLYKDYQNVDMSVYFNAAVSLQAKESVAASLQPMLSGMKELEKVNFLLSFVQKAFAYKTDPEQFGREKFFFAEEVFFYPFCDCEDRSVLFSYLVRELVGLNVVGLEYPEHISTAVQFTSKVSGDYVNYGQSQYVISDPTYIGASVGMAMPQFKSVSPSIIPMQNTRGEDITEKSLWNLAQKGGCYPASNLPNIVKLSDGSSVLTGYYNGSASLAGKALSNSNNINACFVGRMLPDGKPGWVLSMAATGNTVGVSATADSKGNIFIAGSFRGKLTAGGTTLSTKGDKPDAFVASLSTAGDVRWIRKLNLDSIPSDAPVAFSATFNTEGKSQGVIRTGVYDDFLDYGLFTNGTDKLVYNGIVNRVFSATPSSVSAKFASEVIAASPELLKKEVDTQLQNQTDKGVAGLFAAINLVKNMGVTLSGSDAQTAFDKYNPGFKKYCPNIYKNLSRINFVKNTEGIITIMTENGDDIMIDKIRVKNKSTLSISSLPSGDLQFDILSGIKVGKMVVWFTLNSIRLYRLNGDMLFDYDKDHSQQTMNMRKDILK